MHYYEVMPTRIARAGQATFTYSYGETLQLGQIVSVPLGTKSVNGIVTEKVQKPDYDVKAIDKILEISPLPNQLIALINWLSDYYVTPHASVLQTVLPRGLDKKRRPQNKTVAEFKRNRTNFVLNPDQQAAVSKIHKMKPGTALLHGVTGSGKTAVYIELARQTLESGKSVIVLVPEIALTSQVVAEFSNHFADVLLTHSKQTEAERHLVWQEALTSSKPRLVIGPRSALFMPLKDIGLIVIDEAHEPSYKQEQSPRYSALRAASQLSSSHGAHLVLGSATPNVNDYFMASHTNSPIIEMTKIAAGKPPKPDITLVDMTKRANFKKHRFFSDKMLTQIEQTHSSGKQSLLFHNRRGSASVTLCENCGWQAGCPHCFVPLTLHADKHQLRCHICGLNSTVPSSCPQCSHAEIIHKGIGTKLIESELARLMPKLKIARFDGDSDNDQTLNSRYNELYTGSIDVIIGTQVIAKGLDLPHLRTVGIVQADAGLSLPDFAAPERAFQLLAQAIGRVGRSSHETNIVVQSYQPTHPIVQAGIAQDYSALYQQTLSQRKRANFPPFCYLLKLTCQYKTERSAVNNSKKLASELRSKLPAEVEILGPTPAFYERLRDNYRWQLVLKSPKRALLVDALSHLPAQYWQYELDPASLL